jgi:hypothetical protein
LDEDPKLCAACGGAIGEGRAATARVELAQGELACFYHPDCFQNSSPEQYLTALCQLAALLLATVSQERGLQPVLSGFSPN